MWVLPGSEALGSCQPLGGSLGVLTARDGGEGGAGHGPDPMASQEGRAVLQGSQAGLA